LIINIFHLEGFLFVIIVFYSSRGFIIMASNLLGRSKVGDHGQEVLAKFGYWS
jgi:hypothetical protein